MLFIIFIKLYITLCAATCLKCRMKRLKRAKPEDLTHPFRDSFLLLQSAECMT